MINRDRQIDRDGQRQIVNDKDRQRKIMLKGDGSMDRKRQRQIDVQRIEMDREWLGWIIQGNFTLASGITQ